MELLRGASLEEVCRRGPLGADEVLEIGIELCEALEALHAEGVIHRDLKPANVIVLAEPEAGRRVKLLDLGVAKLMPAFYAEGEAVTPPEGRIQTQAGMPLGTPGYMAPEQARGEVDRQGPATDVHALGGLLYEILEGRPPRQARTLEELLPRLNHLPPPPHGGALGALTLRCLAPEPQARPKDAGELLALVDRVMG